MKTVHVHWQFKTEPTLEALQLCDYPRGVKGTTHSIVFRPVIHQQRGGRLRECPDCAKIGKELGIP